MRNREMKICRDRHTIKHRYFKYKHPKVNNLYELVEEVKQGEEDLIILDLIIDRYKDRRLLILNLAKTFVRDFEMSGNGKFYNIAIDILENCIYADKLELNIE